MLSVQEKQTKISSSETPNWEPTKKNIYIHILKQTISYWKLTLQKNTETVFEDHTRNFIYIYIYILSWKEAMNLYIYTYRMLSVQEKQKKISSSETPNWEPTKKNIYIYMDMDIYTETDYKLLKTNLAKKYRNFIYIYILSWKEAMNLYI